MRAGAAAGATPGAEHAQRRVVQVFGQVGHGRPHLGVHRVGAVVRRAAQRQPEAVELLTDSGGVDRLFRQAHMTAVVPREQGEAADAPAPGGGHGHTLVGELPGIGDTRP